jgi:electron transfer flavoprotein alpha/beta subunit
MEVVGRACICQLYDLECCLGSHTTKWMVEVVFIATNQIVVVGKAAGDGRTGQSGAPATSPNR